MNFLRSLCLLKLEMALLITAAEQFDTIPQCPETKQSWIMQLQWLTSICSNHGPLLLQLKMASFPHKCLLLALSITNSYGNIYSHSRENSGCVALGQNSYVSMHRQWLQRRLIPLQQFGPTVLSESCSFASKSTGVKLDLFLFTSSSFTSQKLHENHVSSLLQSHIHLQHCGRTPEESIWPGQSCPLGQLSLLHFPDTWHSAGPVAGVSHD